MQTCKCKWFTLTWDLHVTYTAIDSYTHNIVLYLRLMFGTKYLTKDLAKKR
jgi:hypothetical protein